MKTPTLLFLFVLQIILTSAAHGQTVGGYIRTAANDSLPVRIKLQMGSPLKLIEAKNRSVVVDSAGTDKEYTPKDIKGYGYTDKGFHYNYLSKPTKNGTLLFLEPYAVGGKASLYAYSVERSMGGMSTYTDYYTIERPSPQTGFSYMYLDNWENSQDIKDALLGFYPDAPNLKQIVEQKFKKKKNQVSDLKQVIEFINQPPAQP